MEITVIIPGLACILSCYIKNSNNALIGIIGFFFIAEFLRAHGNPLTSKVCQGSLLLNYFLSILCFIILLLLEYSTNSGFNRFAGIGVWWIRKCCSQQQRTSLGIMKELKDETKRNLIPDSNANMRSVLDEDAMREREFVQKNKLKLLHAISILLTDI